ncbi:Fic family protein [Weissella viridescens]|uniref:Fic family protein n=1 Tax=Weissella viridescens TaxID=1629 RepID=UPI003AF2C55A
MNKFKFDQQTEELLYKKSIPNILHDGAQFEDIPITLLQTQEIVNNSPINGIKPDDVVTVHNMHMGAKYVLEHYKDFDFENLKELHAYTGADDTVNAGQLRKGVGAVQTTRGEFTPDRVYEQLAQENFENLLNDPQLDGDTKAAKVFSSLSRAQLFNDTNKRTAVLAANIPLLREGAGVFYIPEPAMENTLQLMSDYYWNNDDRLLVAVLKDVAINDYDGKTFYDPKHDYYEYADEYKKHINLFKGLNAKGILGKEKVQELTRPPYFPEQSGPEIKR